MRKQLLPLFTLLSALFMHGVGLAQSSYASEIQISEQASVALTNYQVHLTINTQDLISQGKMNADGSDMRFYEDGCLTLPLNHWIEAGINTTATDVWVLVPSIPASAVTTIYMGYGDALATTTSNFSATFPLAIISGGGALNLTGTITTDWFQLDGGDVLTVINGAPLTINARKIIINGTVTGNGAGYSGGAAGSGSGNFGSGPGGGTPSNPMNSGCGGGSYGGVGGTGGFDPGDSPGVGGAVYGTDTGTDFDMGSGGAASDLNFGGNGGGAFSMNAEYIVIPGTINMNGASAQQPGGGRGAGGGAGGSVIAIAKDLTFSGTITANGGGGSIGTSTANDDGGSGAGGRVKLMYSGTIDNTGTVSVVGGSVGTNGTGGAPTVGGTGTYFEVGFISIDNLVISTSAEEDLTFAPIITSTGPACQGETITLSAGAVYSSYSWSTGATTASIDVTSGGPYTLNAGIPFCPTTTVSGSVTVTFNALPLVDLGADMTICDTTTVTLDAGAGFSAYDWSTGATSQTIDVDGGTLGVGTFPFDVTVTDGNGCENSSNISIEVEDCTNGLSENELAQAFEVYPNPVSGELTVKIELANGLTTELSITDMSGKVVYAHGTFNSALIQTMDVSALQVGTYFVEISNANGRATRMIVKN